MVAPKIAFVLSSERSGSTLLRVMLGAHTSIVACGELFLLRYPDFATWYQAKPLALLSVVEFYERVGKPRGPEAICRMWDGRTTGEIYRQLVDVLPQDKMLVDKTPAYANEPETLQKTLEFTPFYIWLTRHPLGVIHSSIRVKQRRESAVGVRRVAARLLERCGELTDAGMGPRARAREIKWLVQQRNIFRFLTDVPAHRKLRISYEQLVSNPKHCMLDVCRGLGIAFEDSMLSPFVALPKLVQGLGDENIRSTTKIESGPAEQWRVKYREKALRSETRDFMKQLGINSFTSSVGSRRLSAQKWRSNIGSEGS
jgi:hypothetical protein